SGTHSYRKLTCTRDVHSPIHRPSSIWPRRTALIRHICGRIVAHGLGDSACKPGGGLNRNRVTDETPSDGATCDLLRRSSPPCGKALKSLCIPDVRSSDEAI